MAIQHTHTLLIHIDLGSGLSLSLLTKKSKLFFSIFDFGGQFFFLVMKVIHIGNIFPYFFLLVINQNTNIDIVSNIA